MDKHFIVERLFPSLYASQLMVSKALRVGLLVVVFALMGKGWHWAKDGFSIQRTAFPLFEKIPDLSPDGQVAQALNQRFFLFGKRPSVLRV